MNYRLTINASHVAARAFIDVVKDGRQWSLASASNALPLGWRLSEDARDGDFMPLTVANCAAAFRRLAVRTGNIW